MYFHLQLTKIGQVVTVVGGVFGVVCGIILIAILIIVGITFKLRKGNNSLAYVILPLVGRKDIYRATYKINVIFITVAWHCYLMQLLEINQKLFTRIQLAPNTSRRT